MLRLHRSLMAFWTTMFLQVQINSFVDRIRPFLHQIHVDGSKVEWYTLIISTILFSLKKVFKIKKIFQKLNSEREIFWLILQTINNLMDVINRSVGNIISPDYRNYYMLNMSFYVKYYFTRAIKFRTNNNRSELFETKLYIEFYFRYHNDSGK